jgi:arginase
MRDYVIVEAPTNLGLHPGGVERLSAALIDAGFAERLRAPVVSRVVPPPYDPVPDPETHIMNARAIAAYTRDLADPVGRAIDAGQFPIVLGGDCSILLGNVLALRRRGRFGLLFVDGHNDCYEPGTYPTAEVAAMDLAQSVGVGPEFLTNIDELRPYVRASDTVVFGTRDSCDGHLRGRMSTPAGILEMELSEIRHMGIDAALSKAIRGVKRPELSGVWLHLDVDVLDDAIMPAVDYRRPDGLSWTEFETSVRAFLGSGLVVGINVTIFNPSMDPDGSIAKDLTECLLRGLA